MDIQTLLLKRVHLRRELADLRATPHAFAGLGRAAKVVKYALAGQFFLKQIVPSGQPILRVLMSLIGYKVLSAVFPQK